MPSGPVTVREVGVGLKETDGWKLIGVFPMLDVCPRVTDEEENGRTTTLNLWAEVRGIIFLNESTDAYGTCRSVVRSRDPFSQGEATLLTISLSLSFPLCLAVWPGPQQHRISMDLLDLSNFFRITQLDSG